MKCLDCHKEMYKKKFLIEPICRKCRNKVKEELLEMRRKLCKKIKLEYDIDLKYFPRFQLIDDVSYN